MSLGKYLRCFSPSASIVAGSTHERLNVLSIGCFSPSASIVAGSTHERLNVLSIGCFSPSASIVAGSTHERLNVLSIGCFSPSASVVAGLTHERLNVLSNGCFFLCISSSFSWWPPLLSGWRQPDFNQWQAMCWTRSFNTPELKYDKFILHMIEFRIIFIHDAPPPLTNNSSVVFSNQLEMGLTLLYNFQISLSSSPTYHQLPPSHSPSY